MKYINGIPIEVLVLVKHRRHKEEIEGIISHNNDIHFLFHNNKIDGGHPKKFGYSKSWVFAKTRGGFTENILSVRLAIQKEEYYEIF
jgi:hypothetical protein